MYIVLADDLTGAMDTGIQFRGQQVARDQQIPQPALDQQKRVPVDHIIGRR